MFHIRNSNISDNISFFGESEFYLFVSVQGYGMNWSDQAKSVLTHLRVLRHDASLLISFGTVLTDADNILYSLLQLSMVRVNVALAVFVVVTHNLCDCLQFISNSMWPTKRENKWKKTKIKDSNRICMECVRHDTFCLHVFLWIMIWISRAPEHHHVRVNAL